MHKTFLMFLVLTVTFFGTWAFKYKNPEMRPDAYADGYDASKVNWWVNKDGERIRPVDDSWKLDPEIPINYIPVPGEDNLFMVID